MASVDRIREQASRRARRLLAALGEEFRTGRLEVGLSQASVAEAVRISRPRYCEIEAGRVDGLKVLEAARVAAVLGLELSVRAFPGGEGIRDAAQLRKLALIGGAVSSPLRFRTEVPLPRLVERPEPRAWDGVIEGRASRTKVEVEMRLQDGQAVARRIALKNRDDPIGGLLIVVADTDRNRRMLALYPGLFADLPRLRPSRVLACLRAGEQPPSGLVLL